MTFFGKIKSGFKKTLGKVAGGAKTVLKKADGFLDKAENIGNKLLSTPIVGDMLKTGWEQLKASNPKLAIASGAVKGLRDGIEKANDTVSKIENLGNKYIDDPKKLLSKEVKKDFNDVRSQVKNIASFPPPQNMAM